MNREEYLKFFTYTSQSVIKDFCDDLQNSKADCFVILPRKAVCLVKSLLLAGLLPKEFSNKPMYFSSNFTLNNSTFVNKKIAIVDDVAITGVSIAEATNMLIDTYGVKPQNIEIIILAANSDSFFLDFTDEKSKKSLLNSNSLRKLNKTDCSELCSNIATVLCSMGIPYDCEFPNYNSITISSENYRELFSPLFWENFNVSNQFHQKSGINVITLIPVRSTNNEIYQKIGIDLHNWIHFKIRVFSKHIDQNMFEVRIVPMAIIDEMQNSYICRLYETLIGKNFETKDILTKFRLLQFYFAFNLGELFWSKNNALKKPNLELTLLFGLFGTKQKEILSILSSQTFNKDFYYHNDAIPEPIPNNAFNNSTEKSLFLSFEPNNLFSKSIIQLYEDRQSFAKEYFLSKKNFRNLHSSEFAELKAKSLYPYSYNYFCEMISNSSNYYDTNNLVSIFLDRATDLGFIVPTVYTNNEIICKAYRHGEGSSDITNDPQCIKLFISFFRSYVCKKMGSFSQISSIDLEKIIVLFCYFADQKEILNNFMKFDNDCFITKQYSIHGAIPITYSFPELIDKDFKFHSYAEDDEYSIWITDLLSRDHCISRVNSKSNSGPYIIHDFNTDDIPKKGKKYSQIKQIAILIGEWYSAYNMNFDANIFRGNATVLTSCESIFSISKALLAEVQYCIRNWHGDFKKESSKTHSDFKDYLNNILKSNSYLAINNGIKKFEDFVFFDSNSTQNFTGRNIMNKTINEIQKILEANNPLAGEMWNEFWDDYRNSKPITDTFLNEAIIDLVNFLYCFSAVYRSFYIVSSSENNNKSLIDALVSQYETNMIKWKKDIVLNCFTECKEIIASQVPVEEKINDLTKIYYSCVQKAKQCRDNIEEHLDLGFNNYTEEYDGCLIILLNTSKDFSTANVIHNVIKTFRKKHNKLLAVEVNNNSRIVNQTQETQLFFIFAKTKNNLNLLFQIMEFIFDNNTSKDKKYSYILCPSLPEEAYYLYSLNSNIQKSNNRFKQKVVNPILEKLKDLNWDFTLISSQSTYDQNINFLVDQSEYLIKTFGSDEPTTSDEIKLMLKETYEMQIYNIPTKKLGIITIREDETAAVIREFNLFENKSKKITYYTGEYKTEHTNYQLYLRRTTGKGNALAASALSMLIKDWDIDFVVLLGVAGTIKPDDANICDVVIANKIIDMTYGSETSDDYMPKTTMPEIDISLIEKINNFQTQIYGQEFPNSDNNPEGKHTFKCAFGSIGDSGHVVKADEAVSRKNLKTIDSSCIAVETESSGVASLLRDWKLENKKIIGPLVIRGISDGADIEKDKTDKFHFTASKNAAIVLKRILPYL